MTAVVALLLAPLALVALAFLDRRGRRRAAQWLGPRSTTLLGERGPRRRRAARAVFASALACAIVAALSAPAAPDVDGHGVDVVVCLDVSRSMLAGDVVPDRLGRAKAEIAALAAAARGDRLGLVAFAGEARRLVPLTDDAASFTELLDLADPTSVTRGGTDLGAALDAALALLEGATGARAAVILVTDGEDHGGRGLAAAYRCAEKGVVVHGVGIGTAIGGKIATGPDGGGFLRDRAGSDVVSTLDVASLSRIADATGGSFVDATARPGAILSLYKDQIARGTAPPAPDASTALFQAPLALALALFLLDLVLAGRSRR